MIHKVYDNFDAINCNRVQDIPIDYDGYIGVPITYLAKHDPTKFRIVGVFNNYDEINLEFGRVTGSQMLLDKAPWKTRGPVIDGKPLYQKTVDCGALPSNTLKDVAHNISNIKFVVDIKGVALTNNNQCIPVYLHCR